jgi:act minimal PKS acyl carrier protein
LRIIGTATGEPLDVGTPEQIQDTEFTELGIDSLALLESATRVELAVGVVIPDDVVPELKSPRLFLEYVVEQAEVA